MYLLYSAALDYRKCSFVFLEYDCTIALYKSCSIQKAVESVISQPNKAQNQEESNVSCTCE
ncbi:hypothetical protein PGIGA_G00035960 [Pangasianodon gigas]|uniref:Uncharacterized protein n=1 Tax=Pangasianodon gigas TaxID=30993 RepID=A0ACC5WYP8_PANGG|nr:hypothetical protein [Pangasianodon gigas]